MKKIIRAKPFQMRSMAVTPLLSNRYQGLVSRSRNRTWRNRDQTFRNLFLMADLRGGDVPWAASLHYSVPLDGSTRMYHPIVPLLSILLHQISECLQARALPNILSRNPVINLLSISNFVDIHSPAFLHVSQRSPSPSYLLIIEGGLAGESLAPSSTLTGLTMLQFLVPSSLPSRLPCSACVPNTIRSSLLKV
jgi:hypothetical protein